MTRNDKGSAWVQDYERRLRHACWAFNTFCLGRIARIPCLFFIFYICYSSFTPITCMAERPETKKKRRREKGKILLASKPYFFAGNKSMDCESEVI
jgi:hypothetical protein